MSDETEWKLLVSFKDDPSPSYVHGFEAGQIWQQMRDGHEDINVTVHVENEGTIHAMADAEGYDVDWQVSDVEGWANLSLHRRPRRGPLNIVK